MSVIRGASGGRSASHRSNHRGWRPGFEALEPRACPAAMLEFAIAECEGVDPSSAVGIHEIQGAVVKINAVGGDDLQTTGGSAVSGRVTGIAADPTDPAAGDRGFISTASGQVWKTKDGGVSWTGAIDLAAGGEMAHGTALPSVTDLVIDRYAADRGDFLLGFGAADGDGAMEMFDSRPGVGVLKSLDSGKTWSREAGDGALTTMIDAGDGDDSIVSSPLPPAPTAQPKPVLLVIANRDFYFGPGGDATPHRTVCTSAPNGDILCLIEFEDR
jgi:hypothetical protein